MRLLIVDDHRLLRDGLARIITLQPDMEVVAEAGNGEEAVALHARHRPDITLMDLQMPIMTGIQAIRAIRAQDAHARIVVLTMYHGDEDVFQAFQAGAMGYLLKDALADDLISILRAVHAGQRVVPPDIVAALEAHAQQPALTPRELQVLELLATGKRNKEIAADLGMSSDTASAHVKNIFHKFGVHDRTAAMAEALRRGIIHIGQGSAATTRGSIQRDDRKH